MFKKWFLRTFFGNRMLLESILMELRNIHYHSDRLEAFYMMVNKIKEDKDKITIGNVIIDKDQKNGKK
ncbi:unnamed protein product [marine sediment metagenome]|uniref:Uncharacterized protein n=1 Tax=marine sediment metagenome TaxID=412755 RepID=X1BDG9_9ZZZZ